MMIYALVEQLPDENLGDMIPDIFSYAHWFMKQYQAFIMIVIAIFLAYAVTGIIVSMFTKNKDKHDDDDDDGFDYI